jgi:long-chain acyl-CoA synthetase
MGLNLAECLDLSAEACPDRTAVALDSLRMSYADVAGAACRVANVLREHGIGRGDRVALLLPNTPQFAVIYYGILYAGATVVSLNPLLKPRELTFCFRDAEVKAAFVWKSLGADLGAALPDLPGCRVVFEVEAGFAPEAPAYGQSFMGAMLQAETAFEVADTRPEDTAVILYTSAMDGRPRGAQLTHFSLFQNAQAITTRVLQYQEGDVCLAVLPLFHSFGQTTMMNGAFISRSTMVTVPRFDAGKVIELVEKEEVTLLAMVPTMFHLLLHYRPHEHFSFPSLKFVVSGGAKMSLALAAAFKERFGHTILEGYGLTETSPVAAFNYSVAANRPGSVGPPIWGCRIRILKDDGTPAAPGETGEVVVRGHNLMKGYLNDDEANAKYFRNGWFHTGDLGYMDEDHYLYLTGVKKDMIIRAGMNIYPKELELLLESRPDIREAAVVGLPDEVRGEEVHAFVVAEHGAAPTEKELHGWMKERVAAYKLPRKIELVESLPRDSAGRLVKELLRAERAHA